MAAGLPVVGNSVGMNRELILPGETGYLADTPEAWRAALGKLNASSALRRRMGATARAFVEEHYSVASWAERFASLVTGAVSPGTLREQALSRRSFNSHGFSFREAA